MEEDTKVEEVVEEPTPEEPVVDSGMNKVNKALDRMLGKDTGALDKVKDMF